MGEDRSRSACTPYHPQGTDQLAHDLPASAELAAPLPAPVPRVALSIVTNSCVLRDGLLGLLARHIDIDLVGAYPAQFPDDVWLANPAGHVVLLDGGVGHPLALRWTTYWRGQSPPAAVLVMELANDIDVILSCIEAGAGGYTLQGASVSEVAEAITNLQHGRAQCSPEVTSHLFARLAAPVSLPSAPTALKAALTDRELEVLRCIAQDQSNQQIADLLVIEVRTVKHHVHNILEKLRVQHRWDAARVAIEQRWITVD